MNLYEQSGVIPYQYIDGKLHIFLITSLKKGHWMVPKGIVEEEHDEIETAVIETYEEAGLIGIVERHLVGSYQVKKWGGVCTINLYPMKVLTALESWPEDEMRMRSCIEADRIWERIHNPGLAGCIKDWVQSQPVR